MRPRPAPRPAALVSVLVVALGAGGCGEHGAGPEGRPPAQPTVLAPEARRAPVLAAAPGGDAVSAWESVTGGPVEAAVRGAGGWDARVALGAPGGADPVVAAGTGGVVVAWRAAGGGGGADIVAARARRGRWEAPRRLGRAGAGAQGPGAAAGADGGVAVAWGAPRRGPLVRVAAPGGGWGRAVDVGPGGGHVEDVSIAAAGDRLLVTWLRTAGDGRRVWLAERTAGRWRAPRPLSAAGAVASDPRPALGPEGTAAVAWRRDRPGNGQLVEVGVRSPGGRWAVSAPAPPAGRPLGLLRPPGPTPRSPAVAVTPGGRVAVVWPERSGGRERVRLAALAGSRWRVDTVPAGGEAGGADVAAAPGGGVLVATEELAGIELALRVRRRTAAGAWACCCARLTPRGHEGAVPRLAALRGGAVAVWNDTARGAVMAADVTCT